MDKEYKKISYLHKSLLKNYDFGGDLGFLENNTEVVRFENIKSVDHSDYVDDICEIVKLCKNKNWDILMIDTTHPKINFSTVRVIIPSISDTINYRFNKFDINSIEDKNLVLFNDGCVSIRAPTLPRPIIQDDRA
jgi:hypothetical protein